MIVDHFQTIFIASLYNVCLCSPQVVTMHYERTQKILSVQEIGVK